MNQAEKQGAFADQPSNSKESEERGGARLLDALRDLVSSNDEECWWFVLARW